jgi:hypothetical protein
MDLEIHVLPFRFHSTNLDSSISSRNVHAIICPPRYFGNTMSYYLYYFSKRSKKLTRGSRSDVIHEVLFIVLYGIIYRMVLYGCNAATLV